MVKSMGGGSDIRSEKNEKDTKKKCESAGKNVR